MFLLSTRPKVIKVSLTSNEAFYADFEASFGVVRSSTSIFYVSNVYVLCLCSSMSVYVRPSMPSVRLCISVRLCAAVTVLCACSRRRQLHEQYDCSLCCSLCHVTVLCAVPVGGSCTSSTTVRCAGQPFVTQAEYAGHMQSRHDVRPELLSEPAISRHRCELCGVTFWSHVQLSEHLNKHPDGQWLSVLLERGVSSIGIRLSLAVRGGMFSFFY